jgi:serine/threonine protein kinase
MAPEMVRCWSNFEHPGSTKKGYGKEIDIWGVGVIAYILMSGEFPFSLDDSESEDIVMQRILNYEMQIPFDWSYVGEFQSFLSLR